MAQTVYDTEQAKASQLVINFERMKTLDPKVLNEIVRRIVQAVQPEKIYLYGPGEKAE